MGRCEPVTKQGDPLGWIIWYAANDDETSVTRDAADEIAGAVREQGYQTEEEWKEQYPMFFHPEGTKP